MGSIQFDLTSLESVTILIEFIFKNENENRTQFGRWKNSNPIEPTDPSIFVHLHSESPIPSSPFVLLLFPPTTLPSHFSFALTFNQKSRNEMPFQGFGLPVETWKFSPGLCRGLHMLKIQGVDRSPIR